jgi:hypothetical protein
MGSYSGFRDLFSGPILLEMVAVICLFLVRFHNHESYLDL